MTLLVPSIGITMFNGQDLEMYVSERERERE